VRKSLAIALIVSGAVAGARSAGESVLLAAVSFALYLIGFAQLSWSPARPTPDSEVFVDKAVVVLASLALLLSLVMTFWARNAGRDALTRASVLGLNASGLAVIALLGLHLTRAAIRTFTSGRNRTE
jgi:hypothetical protein